VPSSYDPPTPQSGGLQTADRGWRLIQRELTGLFSRNWAIESKRRGDTDAKAHLTLAAAWAQFDAMVLAGGYPRRADRLPNRADVHCIKSQLAA
jgi:hypothetical protein